MALARKRWFALRRVGVLFGALALACAWTSCATAPVSSAAAAPPLAHLAIANLTDYTWRVTARSAAGGTIREWPVLPRGSLEIELAGGEYVFEQTIVTPHATLATATRQFPVRFDAGERYGWTLATLLSAGAGEATNTAATVSR